MVEDGAFSHNIDYVTIFLEILHLEGHLSTGERVTAIFLNGCILPIGGASAVEGLRSTGPTPSSYYTTLLFFRPSVWWLYVQVSFTFLLRAAPCP